MSIFLDMPMGASGDMMISTLYGLLDEKDKKAFIEKMNSLFEKVRVEIKPFQDFGVSGYKAHVIVLGQEEESEDVAEREIERKCNKELQDIHVHSHACENVHSHTHEYVHIHGHNHTCDYNQSHDQCHNHTHNHEDEHHAHNHSHNHEDEHHSHQHAHNTLADVFSTIDVLDVSTKVKVDVKRIYSLISQAEARVHGKEPSEVHFHEVGSLDAIFDVVGTAFLMELLGEKSFYYKEVNTGFGWVKCAHGIMPIPAPATALLLEGISWVQEGVEGELLTPTGAAIIKYYGRMTRGIKVNSNKMSNGFGSKKFDRPNILRVFLMGEGNSLEKTTYEIDGFLRDEIYKIEVSLDDITGEDVAFACEKIMESKALEYYITQGQFKKNRPGFILTVLCKEEDFCKVSETIFRHTTTIGLRYMKMNRLVLDRKEVQGEFEGSTIKGKRSFCTQDNNHSIHKCGQLAIDKLKWEHDDLEEIVQETGKTIFEVREGMIENE